MLRPESTGPDLGAAADATVLAGDDGGALAADRNGSGCEGAEDSTERCSSPENRSAGKGIEPELQRTTLQESIPDAA